MLCLSLKQGRGRPKPKTPHGHQSEHGEYETDLVEAGDSEVKREVDRLMHLDGEGVVQEKEEDPLQSQFEGHLERAPLAETSATASRRDTGGIRIRGAVGKERGGGGGRGRGQGKAVAS